MNDIPSVISTGDIKHWDDEADVLIIGYGIAGACAAIEAKAEGADVLIVERASGGGGASATSGGIFYLGGGTPIQEAAGFTDTPENMYKFLMACTGSPDPKVVRRFCESSVEHFHWLEAQGIPFERSYYKDKAVIPPGTYCLSDTGNEKTWPFREIADPVPRGHKVACAEDEAGGVAMKALLGKCEDAGIRARYDSRVRGLIRDEAGRIVGARVKHFDDTFNLRARKAVIVTAGGFGFNKALMEQYVPRLPAAAEALGIDNNDGDGILLGQSVGARTQAMNGVIATGSFYPPGILVKGIVVNTRGERFINEDAYHGKQADFLMDQPGAKAFLILDSECFAYPERPDARAALIDGFETVAEMEAGLSLPEGSLQRTVKEYNVGAAEGEDLTFRKHPVYVAPLDKPPFAAFDISYDSLQYVYLTLGGLKATEEAEVLDAGGQPIPGLYAAGACVSSIPQDGRGYASGLSLGPGSFYGRVAGRNSAAELRNEPAERGVV